MLDLSDIKIVGGSEIWDKLEILKKKTKYKLSCHNTAVTVLVGAYEESRPAKKPNLPPRRGARKFLVQI